MKKIIICLLLLSLILSGCYNYRDVDTLEFVTAFLIDVNEDNMIEIYTRANKGVRSMDVQEESLEIIRFKEQGETTFEAVRNMTLFTSSRLNFSQIRAIVITERAAKSGIDFFIDFIERDQELNIRARIFIYRGDPVELVNLDIKQEDFLGLYLWEVISNTKYVSKALDLSLNDLLNRKYSPSSTYLLPIVQIINTIGTPQLTINGSKVFNKWNEVDEMTEEEVFYYNFLNNKIKSSIINIPNPQYLDYKIGFEILSSKTKSSCNFKDSTFYVNKKINLSVTIGDVQRSLKITDEVIKLLEQQLSEVVTENCMQLFNKYKRKNLDIINAKNLCYKKYPHVDYENIIPRTVLNLEVKTVIQGSSNIINFE